MGIGAGERETVVKAPLLRVYESVGDTIRGTFIVARNDTVIGAFDRLFYTGGNVINIFISDCAPRHSDRAIDNYDIFEL